MDADRERRGKIGFIEREEIGGMKAASPLQLHAFTPAASLRRP